MNLFVFVMILLIIYLEVNIKYLKNFQTMIIFFGLFLILFIDSDDWYLHLLDIFYLLYLIYLSLAIRKLKLKKDKGVN
jgi:hypothetical protein